jgi:hypothetical protein
MAVFNWGILFPAVNSSLVYGFFGGISIAWFFLKSRFRIHGGNTVLSPENFSTCGEVGCMAAVVFSSKSALYFERILITDYCVSAPRLW